MTAKPAKQQYIFISDRDINTALSRNGHYDFETVRLIRQAMGKKFLPLRPAAVPCGEYDPRHPDVFQVTVSSQLVTGKLRRDIDLLAEWIKVSRRDKASWLCDRTTDGRIPAFSRGFDTAVAKARKHFHGTSTPAPAKDVSVTGTTPPGPMTPHDVAAILTHNINDKITLNLDSDYASRNALRVIMKSEKSHIHTTWLNDLDRREVHFLGWGARKNTKQLFANRLALARALDCPVMISSFGMIGKYAFARFGFLPNQESWDRFRDTVHEDLDYLCEQHNVENQTRESMRRALMNPDPRGMWDFVDHPQRIDGKKIAFVMMGEDRGMGWCGKFDMNNPDQMTRARAYVGPDKFDSAFKNAETIIPTVPSKPAGSNPANSGYRSPSDALAQRLRTLRFGHSPD